LAVLLLWIGLFLPLAADELPDLGFFLVASEELRDPRFREAVILVTRHHRGETVGVVVNKPSDVAVTTLFPQSELDDEHAKSIYFGGPVSNQSLLFLIRSKNQPKASLRIFDNVFLSADNKVLAEVLRHPKPFAGLRIFSGYAGWKQGQLETEIENGYWHLREADTEILFHSDPDQMWRKLLEHQGKGHWVKLLRFQRNS
jgi:putative transcriptional regulator